MGGLSGLALADLFSRFLWRFAFRTTLGLWLARASGTAGTTVFSCRWFLGVTIDGFGRGCLRGRCLRGGCLRGAGAGGLLACGLGHGFRRVDQAGFIPGIQFDHIRRRGLFHRRIVTLIPVVAGKLGSTITPICRTIGSTVLRPVIAAFSGAIIPVVPVVALPFVALPVVALPIANLTVTTLTVTTLTIVALAVVAILAIWGCARLSARLTAILATVLTTTLTIALATLITTVLAALALKLLLACLLFDGHFPRRFSKHAGIMFSVLQKVFCSDPVVRQLRITRKLLILLNYLLGRTTNLTLGA